MRYGHEGMVMKMISETLLLYRIKKYRTMGDSAFFCLYKLKIRSSDIFIT